MDVNTDSNNTKLKFSLDPPYPEENSTSDIVHTLPADSSPDLSLSSETSSSCSSSSTGSLSRECVSKSAPVIKPKKIIDLYPEDYTGGTMMCVIGTDDDYVVIRYSTFMCASLNYTVTIGKGGNKKTYMITMENGHHAFIRQT